jgi:hypothetical protein
MGPCLNSFFRLLICTILKKLLRQGSQGRDLLCLLSNPASCHLHIPITPKAFACFPANCSIVSEAYTLGWVATRWIPGGVGVYMGFLLLAPRLHAFGKSRGYMTISEFLYDRYLPPSGAPWVRQGRGIGVTHSRISDSVT